jgi:dTDP-glucose 4,6-dehydratase
MVNLDVLTYAANLENLKEVEKDDRYGFVKGDIRDEKLVESLCLKENITHIVHFAAESHVDRSIEGPKSFFSTNVGGTLSLLEVVRKHPHLHFHHVSTDEVYGSLGTSGYFCESSPYMPNSPYSASKAASDHFVRAYTRTYGLFTTLSHCSNNFGPYQHREKFIPRMIDHALNKKPLPIFGDGSNIRDWLFVDDHVEALWLILQQGKKEEVYDIGGGREKKNLDLVYELMECLSSLTGESLSTYHHLISFVPDRLGHDFRYAIDCSKIRRELGWQPRYSFEMRLKETVQWYLEKMAGKNESCLCHSSSS